jgi:hypothetical protein
MTELSRFDADTLYAMLPALYRARDAEEGNPLRALIEVIAEQVAVLEEDLAQRYDDHFIETCAEWVVPYIGDLVGVRGLHAITPVTHTQRPLVANEIAYRRRKGTTAVLEDLARDATGWPAKAVEFFLHLAANHHLDRLRQRPRNADLRARAPLEYLDTAFNTFAHTSDVRRISTQGGKYNIPNVGIYLWRLQSYASPQTPAHQLDARRYLFSPLGNNMPLYNFVEREDAISHLATRRNVPMPLSRRELADGKSIYYGRNHSLYLRVDGNDLAAGEVIICNLADANGGWAHMPDDFYAIDPVLGRIAAPANQPPPAAVEVGYHYGFSHDMGGGTYARERSFTLLPLTVRVHSSDPAADAATIQGAINALGNRSGVIEIRDSARYIEAPDLALAAGQNVEIRAAERQRPHIALNGPWQIHGTPDSEVTLNGLLISGDQVNVTNDLQHLAIVHCTLTPGRGLNIDNSPVAPQLPALVVEAPTSRLTLDHTISGAIRTAATVSAAITNSIVDATGPTLMAYAALNGTGPGGPLEQVSAATFIGQVHTTLVNLASNSIFHARRANAGDPPPFVAVQTQQGCVRYSYLPVDAQAPRRYHCHPTSVDAARRVQPRFTSLRYGEAGYCQLHVHCPPEIWQGADDEAEMGAFHDLMQPQRVANLRVRLDEYLRFGLEAGIIFAS